MSRLTDFYKQLYLLNLCFMEETIEESVYLTDSKSVSDNITAESSKLGLMQIETDLLINDLASTAQLNGGDVLNDEVLLLAKRHGIEDNSELIESLQHIYNLYLDSLMQGFKAGEIRALAQDSLNNLEQVGSQYTLLYGQISRQHNAIVNTAILNGSPFSADCLGLANRQIPKLVVNAPYR